MLIKLFKITALTIVFFLLSLKLYSEENPDTTIIKTTIKQKQLYGMVHINTGFFSENSEPNYGIGFSLFQYLDFDSDRPLSVFITFDFNFFDPIAWNTKNNNIFFGLRFDDRDKSGFWWVADIGSGISYFDDFKTPGVAAINRVSVGYSKFSFLLSTRISVIKDDVIIYSSIGLGYTLLPHHKR